MSLVDNGLISVLLSKADPRYLVNIQNTIKKLNKLELSESEIEWLFLNPSHQVYHTIPRLESIWLIELELKEDNTVDVRKCGRSLDARLVSAGSREALERQMDKTITHPIMVLHNNTSLSALNHYLLLINEDPDFLVLHCREADEDLYDIGSISLRVRDFDIRKLDVYADRIHSILGDCCRRVYYHSFEVYFRSPDSYFSKGFPITKCGLIIYKIDWDGLKKQYVQTNNNPDTYISYLSLNGCKNFHIIDDNPEFWKLVFETSSLWGDNLYNQMIKNGYHCFRIYTDVNNPNFINEEYTGIHWKVVSTRNRSNIDDEETVMRALSSGNGEPYGRD